MLHNFKENKRHPKLTQKATLSHSAELDFSIFSPAGNPPPAFWEGSSRHSIFRVLVIKDLPAEPRPEPANAIFWLLGWLARATSLDSALLFCSMTLSMCTQWGNKVIFSHFISLPGQLETAKIRRSYWSEADKELPAKGWEWEGGKSTFVCLHTAVQSLTYLAFNLRVISV